LFSQGERPKQFIKRADAAKVALIAGRAADCPGLLEEALYKNVAHVLLEKPGAPDVAALERMAELAADADVGVSVGYNKNVASYVTAARCASMPPPPACPFDRADRSLPLPLSRDAEAAAPVGALTTFVHNNAYTPDELDECFQRNAEVPPPPISPLPSTAAIIPPARPSTRRAKAAAAAARAGAAEEHGGARAMPRGDLLRRHRRQHRPRGG
jgi:hypothetical protein